MIREITSRKQRKKQYDQVLCFIPDDRFRIWYRLFRYTISGRSYDVQTAKWLMKMILYVKESNFLDKILFYGKTTESKDRTFNVPEQEQGVSMLESSSSS